MQGIARLLGGFLSFIAIIMFTYLFDESQIGEYNLVLSTLNIVTSLGTLWLSQSILRFFDEKKDLGDILVFILGSSLLCIFMLMFANLFFEFKIDWFVMVYLVLLVLYNVFDAIFRRARKLIDYVILEVIFAFSRVIPMVFIAIVTKNYNSIFLSQSLVLFGFFTMMIMKYKNDISELKVSINFNMLYRYLNYGLPLMGLAISNWFLTTSDRYIIKYFGHNAQVGIYSTNYSLANSIYMMFSLIIVNAFHPIIMKEWDKKNNNVYKLVSYTIDLYLIIMIPLTFYGCLKSKILLSLFKGNLYATYYDIFIWTAVGIFFYGISLLLHKYYELIKNTKMILFFNLIVAMLNIFLNVLLIPLYGFNIAAFTTFISYIMYILIVRLLTRKVFPIKINIKNFFISIISVCLFYYFDIIFVKNSSITMFFIEGILFVVYILLVYLLTGILKLEMINILLKRNHCK